MKKLLAILLALALVFSFAACGKKEPADSSLSTNDTNATTQTGFTAPENYATVLLVTINPQFKLYLDASNKVLAVEPVNDDAKAVAKDNTFTGELDAVIEKIVTAANDGGFVKENATVNFEVTELVNKEVKTDELLANVKTIADTAFKNINVNININVNVNVNVNQNEQTPSQNTSNKPISSEHTHSYKAATCTEPQKCACGATKGNALGHAYKGGKCTRCGIADPNAAKYTSVLTKAGFWSCRYIYMNGDVGEQLYDATLIFKSPGGEEYADYEDSMIFVGGSRLAEPEDITMYPEEVFEYNGKHYMGAFGNGGNALGKVEEKNNTIVLTDPDGDGDTIKLQRISETTLKVVSCSGEYSDLRKIPVGTVLTFSTTL